MTSKRKSIKTKKVTRSKTPINSGKLASQSGSVVKKGQLADQSGVLLDGEQLTGQSGALFEGGQFEGQTDSVNNQDELEGQSGALFESDHIDAQSGKFNNGSQAEDQSKTEGNSAQEVPKRKVSGKRKLSKKKQGKSKAKTWLLVALVVVLVSVIASCSVIAWDRWLRYDDVQDFQGQWIDVRTNLPIEIDSESIHLTQDVSYPYTLDTHEKTIEYTFTDLSGDAMYLFSSDRNTLYIVEGERRDLVFDVLCMLGIKEYPDYLSLENATVLKRAVSEEPLSDEQNESQDNALPPADETEEVEADTTPADKVGTVVDPDANVEDIAGSNAVTSP